MNINFFTKLKSSQIELLKWLAIFGMILDHVGFVFFPDEIEFRIIGRIAFPLFAFLLVHNYLFFTRDKIKFIQRLFVFSLISQPFYMFVFPEKMNIFILLSLSLFFINRVEHYSKFESFLTFFVQPKSLLTIFSFLAIPPFLVYFDCNIDYGIRGLLLILITYLTFRNVIWLPLFLLLLFILNLSSTIEYAYATMSVILILLVVFKLPNIPNYRVNKWFFYIFYPAHLFIIFMVSLYFL